MPVYTLYLTTKITDTKNGQIVPILPPTLSTSNLSNVSWSIDWDNLFRRNQYDYKYCRVRFDLVSESFAASTPATNDWTNYGGYISLSLASSYNAITTNGTIIGQIWPMDCPITGSSIHCINISSMSENGVDVNIPSGTGILNIQMIKGDGFVPMTTFQQYNILLSFELYNL